MLFYVKINKNKDIFNFTFEIMNLNIIYLVQYLEKVIVSEFIWILIKKLIYNSLMIYPCINQVNQFFHQLIAFSFGTCSEVGEVSFFRDRMVHEEPAKYKYI
jgi:hypothetical protein